MKLAHFAALILVLFTISGAYFAGVIQFSTLPGCGITQIESIALPGIVGRIDHMAYDDASNTLFVAALGSNSVEVLNVSAGKVERTLSGFSKPQGVLFVPTSNSLFVSNGGTGIVNVLDATSFRVIANLSFGSDADNLRFDQASNRVYVGYGQGGIAAISPTALKVSASVQLSGHPEGFQVDASSNSIYVNVPTSSYVAVVNTTGSFVSTRWSLTNSSGNFPMAIDSLEHRLFIGARSPSQLLVLDSLTGRQVAALGVPQDPDDVYQSGTTGCIFVSSGEGFVTMVKGSDSTHYSIVGEVPTSPGARTSLLASSSGPLFVAEPAGVASEARVVVFKVA